MNKTKAIIDFTDYKDAQLNPVARTIHGQMSANAVTFPEPPVDMAALLALIGDYAGKLAAKSSLARADTMAFKTARKALEAALAFLGGYVNSVALGDALIVVQSGVPSYGTARPVSSAPPAAPADLRLKHGVRSGSITARCRPDRRRSTNELQVTSGNPTDEAGWRLAMSFSGMKATLTGLTVGSTIWVRARTIGPGGVQGAWSDPAKITVI